MEEPFSATGPGGRPTLSVVVPVYNVEAYLRECLDSIIAQTLWDLEIVVVNDCSPDASDAIILEYQARDPRIKSIAHRENQGLGAARNTGLRHARGEWVAFVDSDDRVAPYCYASALELIRRYDADGAVFGVVPFDDLTGIEDPSAFPFNRAFPNPTRFGPEVPSHVIGPTVWNRVYRTADLVDNAIWFPQQLKHEDEEFTFKYLAKVEPLLVHDPRYGYQYRQRAGSIMQSSASSRRDLSQILVNILRFLEAERLQERYRAHVIAKAREYLGYFAGPGAGDEPSTAFIRDLRDVVDALDLTRDELDALPPYFLALFMTNGNARASLLARDLPRTASSEEYTWLRFGRLPRKQKLTFLLERAVRSIGRALRRSRPPG